MWLEAGAVSNLLAGRHMVLGSFDAVPKWGSLFPGQALQHLLLHMIQMFYHLPEQTLLCPNQNLNHLRQGKRLREITNFSVL